MLATPLRKNTLMKNRTHILLLLVWLLIGSILRFVDLASLPPWTDECATIVFSLGNTFQKIPLSQVISDDTLLQPFIPISSAGIGDVLQHLFGESTHPPLYFILTHLWMKLFSNSEEIVSIWVVRSISALFGVLSIPVIFGCSYLIFRSKLVAQIAAAIMAVSPFTIFLARQARHYTLPILLIIISLFCLIKAVENISRQQPLSLWIGFLWSITNIIGVATHYFFALTLCAEGLVLFGYVWQNIRKRSQNVLTQMQLYLWRLSLVAIASFIGCIIWLPMVQSVYGSEPTDWVVDSHNNDFISPIVRLLLWVLSIFSLLPSAPLILPTWAVAVSGAITLLLLVWIRPYLFYGLKVFSQSNCSLPTQVLTRFVVISIILFFFCTYFLGIDLTLAVRFLFVFAPGIILLVSALLAVCWQRLKKPSQNGKLAVKIVWLVGLIGGLTTAFNFGYLQNMRPDLLAALIHETSQVPVLIASPHKHHGQTGRIMGLAWQFKYLYAEHADKSQNNWQFFLAQRDAKTNNYTDSIQKLKQSINQISSPLDLWLVNFSSSANFESKRCVLDEKYNSRVVEYNYKLYHCNSQTLNK